MRVVSTSADSTDSAETLSSIPQFRQKLYHCITSFDGVERGLSANDFTGSLRSRVFLIAVSGSGMIKQTLLAFFLGTYSLQPEVAFPTRVSCAGPVSTRTLGAGALVDRVLRFFANNPDVKVTRIPNPLVVAQCVLRHHLPVLPNGSAG